MPIAWLIPANDFAEIEKRLNPYYPPFDIAIPGSDNKNIYLHTSAEAFPYTGSSTALSVHVMRLFAIAMGLATVFTGMAIFRLLWPDRPECRLLALAVLCFAPQFIYLSSVISNDRLAFLLSSLVLLLALRIQRDGLSRWLALLFSVALGLALITKVNTLFLAFPAGLALLLGPGFRRSGWRHIPMMAVIIAVIIAPWYLHNLARYGDPTASNMILVAWKGDAIHEGSLAWDIALSRAPFLYQTAWARFGGGATGVGELNIFFDGLTLLALVGLVVQFLRRLWKKRLAGFRPSMLVVTFVLVWCGVAFYQAAKVWSGVTGRYLLTGIAGWSVLITWGLSVWTIRPGRNLQILAMACAMAVVAVVCTYGYYVPAYSIHSVPATVERPLAIRYGDLAELIGMSPALPDARPGDVVYITLYWRALRAGPATLQSFLHTIDPAIIKRDSLPATGNLLASDWQPGMKWAEHYAVRISPNAPAQAIYPLSAGLYDPAAKTAISATDFKGNPVTPLIGRIAIHGDVVQETPYYYFGDRIGLAAPPRLSMTDNTLNACFRWISLAGTSVDYVAYVHLVTGENTDTLSDRQPKDGQYPTSAWLPGEVINDCVSIPIPGDIPSGWKIAIGLYAPDSIQRLPVIDQQRIPLPNNEIVLRPE